MEVASVLKLVYLKFTLHPVVEWREAELRGVWSTVRMSAMMTSVKIDRRFAWRDRKGGY